MMRRLAQFKNRKFVGVKELAHEAETLLREMGSEQERGNVSGYPNERTIRFYLSEGLLSQPEEKKGAALVFNYSHLLTLLVIKKLQVEAIPNGFIRSLVVGKHDFDLEIILSEEIKTVTDPDEIDFYARMTPAELNDEFGEEVILQSVFPKTEEADLGEIAFAACPDEELEDDAPPISDKNRRTNKAADYLRSLLVGSPHDEADQMPLFSVSRRTSPTTAHAPHQNWTRYEIGRGLELHICEKVVSASKNRIGRKEMLKIAKILGLTEFIRNR